MKQLKNTLSELTVLFRNHGFESPDLEAKFILSEVTHIREMELTLHEHDGLTQVQLEKIGEFLRRRLSDEPYQYIFGWTPFRDLDLKVGKGVLIPRPETEFLVEKLLKRLKKNASVCELGVGSGAISLALGYERRDLSVKGSELSSEALSWARRNLKKYDLGNVAFYEGDLFSPFGGEKFDAVAANLPYIDPAEKENLPPNVREYEPECALFAPDQGYALTERAIAEGAEHLNDEGIMMFEIGETQGERLLRFAEKHHFSGEVEKDLFGAERYLFLKKNSSL